MKLNFVFWAIFAVLVCGASLAGAQDRAAVSREKSQAEHDAEEAIGGERIARAPASSARNGVSRKRYPGGADEDDLQVQETLPIPTRNLEGTAAAAAERSAAEGETPAAND